MSIIKKIRISSAINILLALLLVFSIVKLGNTLENERIAADRFVEYKALGERISDASDYLTDAARQYVQFGEKKYLDLYWQEVNETKTREHVIARLKEMKTDKKVFEYLQKAVDASNGLIKTEEDAFAAVEREDFQEARQLMFGEYYAGEKEKITALTNDFKKVIYAISEAEVAKAKKMSNTYKMLSYISMILIAISVIASSVVTGNGIRNLKKIKLRFDELASADGDLTTRIAYETKDEIGDIARSFNVFIDKTQQIIQTVSSSCITVDEQSTSFSNSSNNISILSADISHAVDDIANGATELAIQPRFSATHNDIGGATPSAS